jgi:CysZ protein
MAFIERKGMLMRSVLQGIRYNLKGLRLGLKSPKLLLLGMLRFAVMVIITVSAAVLILANYQEILGMMWSRPESAWIVWLWYLVSWLLALLLTVISTVVAFLIAQVFFSVLIMDYMSQLTERQLSGKVQGSVEMPFFARLLYLLKQEIPRALLPIFLSLVLLVFSWFTPLGPVLTVLSPVSAAIFLSWDNTDLVPARRLGDFRTRWQFLRRHLGFHIGFGLLFLIPVLNILLLSFAPVGATMFYIEQIDGGHP